MQVGTGGRKKSPKGSSEAETGLLRDLKLHMLVCAPSCSAEGGRNLSHPCPGLPRQHLSPGGSGPPTASTPEQCPRLLGTWAATHCKEARLPATQAPSLEKPRTSPLTQLQPLLSPRFSKARHSQSTATCFLDNVFIFIPQLVG